MIWDKYGYLTRVPGRRRRPAANHIRFIRLTGCSNPSKPSKSASYGISCTCDCGRGPWPAYYRKEIIIIIPDNRCRITHCACNGPNVIFSGYRAYVRARCRKKIN